jgi:hypothetical protein
MNLSYEYILVPKSPVKPKRQRQLVRIYWHLMFDTELICFRILRELKFYGLKFYATNLSSTDLSSKL